MQVLSLAIEEGMLLDLEEDVEIARRSAVRAGLAFGRQAYARIIIHSRRNRDLELALNLPEAVAAALAARVADDLARTAAGAASAPDGEETLLIQNLTAAVACGALGWSAAGLRSRAGAPVAAVHARHLDVGVNTEHRLFERQLQVVAHILAALRTVAPPAAGASAEQIADVEEVPQDIAEIGKSIGVETRRAGRTLQPCVAITVVSGALLRIAQNAVSFRRRLKILLGVGAVRIAVGMELERELAVCALDLRIAGVLADTQYFVIVSFRHGIQMCYGFTATRTMAGLRSLPLKL